MTKKIPNIAIWITHAPKGAGRGQALRDTLDTLRSERAPMSFIQEDNREEGSLSCFLEAMRRALHEVDMSGHTHILRLADDTPVHPGFGILCGWLASLDLAVPGPIDLIVNTDHPQVSAEAQKQESTPSPCLYVSADAGCTGATLWPISLLRRYLNWRERWLGDDIADDRGVNLWSVAEAVPVYKPVRSLVGHRQDIPSLDGNGGDAHREPLYPMTREIAEAWAARLSDDVRCIRIGRTYSNVQRELFYRRKGFWAARARASLDQAAREMRRAGADTADVLPLVSAKTNLDDMLQPYVLGPYLTPTIIERAYAAERHGAPLDPKGVAICCPAQRGLHAEVTIAMHAAAGALRDAGYRVSYILTSGHSLVTRARHRLQHLFMTSDCTWMLSWDDDVVPLDPSVIVRMLKTEHPIVAGAYPLRGNADVVAANPLRQRGGMPIVKVEEDGTACVRDAATGFLLVKRTVFADLMARHPERFYLDRGNGFVHAPMWDLFSTFVDPGEPMGSKGASEDPNAEFWPTYRSEDYGFCTLAREAGHEVRIMMDARFDHHGVGVYRGSAAEAWLPKAKPIA